MRTRTTRIAPGIDASSASFGVDGRDAVHAQSVRPLEVDEQHADLGMRPNVPQGEEHSVAVVHGERKRVLVDDLHESRRSTLVRALRMPVGVARREEEHVARLDELLRVRVDRVGNEDVVDSVGNPARVELVLPVAMIFAECHPVIIATRTSG